MSVNKPAIAEIIARMKAREAQYHKDTEADYQALFAHVVEFDTYAELYSFARKVSPTYERFCLSMNTLAPMFWKKKEY